MAIANRWSAAALPFHHGSHRHLLNSTPAASLSHSAVEAIVVPTARHGASLQSAIDLAARLGCTLVTLCSEYASAADAAERARRAGIELVAIDTAVLPADLIPSFETTNLLRGTSFEHRSDTSLKRNLGLLFARLVGWQRIVFLDDDIAVPEPGDLRDAVQLLDSYAGVGLAVDGFPDNSVVCHAYREAGGPQDTFIGGGALAVGPTSMSSFFPNIYNEDWFFLLDNVGLRPLAVTGGAVQQPYDPFRDDSRAQKEEFGDCLAEGVFWLLDRGRRVQDANERYWRTFLRKRLQFISEVIGMVRKMDNTTTERERMITALKAARLRSQLIEPSLCVEYLNAWHTDRERWRRHVEERHSEHVVEKALPQRKNGSIGLEPDKALSELGLTLVSEYVPAGAAAKSSLSRAV